MSKTTEGLCLGLTPEDSVESRSDDRRIRIIQAILAIYLLPALVLVLLVGFSMLLAGALTNGVLRLARLFSLARWFARRPEPLVSGAWVYKIGGGSAAGRRKRQAEAVHRAGWLRKSDSNVLN